MVTVRTMATTLVPRASSCRAQLLYQQECRRYQSTTSLTLRSVAEGNQCV